MIETHAVIGFVLGNHFLDLCHQQPFAGRTALMRTQVGVGKPFILDQIDADLVLVAIGNDFLVPILEFGRLADMNFLSHLAPFTLCR